MRATVYWLPLLDGWRLAIMPRPRAGEWLADEIAAWKAEGIDIVVSLLEPHEMAELGLQRLPESCRDAGIEFITFPIPDRGVPASPTEADRLVASLCGALAAGKSVAVHCRAGIGRSALIAACVLVRAGRHADAAFEVIGKARGIEVPDTAEQRAWVRAFPATEAPKRGLSRKRHLRSPLSF
jgi:protein-tyrosine phosphatase